jgi:hypothetical protein
MSGGDYYNYNDASSYDFSYWNLPNDFSMFLTQRSIQSFMFLTRQLRDPETCYWVEDFTRPNLVPRQHAHFDEKFSLSDSIPNLNDIAASSSDSGAFSNSSNNNNNNNNKSDSKSDADNEDDTRTCHLLRYHGLAAMDTTLFPTWESYFENLLEQPTDQWVIASDQSHIPDYTWEIDPASLCSRILSVREQLSKEFAKDLQAVSDMGGQTFDWYWEKLRQSRDNERQQQQQQQQQQQEEEGGHAGFAAAETTKNDSKNESVGTPLIEPSSLKGSRENLLFLEINVDDPRLDHKPSPLRRSNFDLLVLLATEEAIHRVLNRWETKRSEGDLVGSERASQSFLERFYQDRQQFFHGPLPTYGKADDLLEELLDSALHFRAGDDGDGDTTNTGEASVVHPTKIAELVLKERERVALDWMAIAKEAPKDHMKIQKLRLDKMMMAMNNNNGNNNGNDNNNGNGNGNDNDNNAGHVASAADRSNGGFDPGPGAFE